MKRLSKSKTMRVVKNSPPKKNPVVSVVMIALNEEKLVGQTLSSLRKQSFSLPYEIILADGNSEDRTVEIAKRQADKIIIEKRRNCAFERNAGAMLADSGIIAFADSDSVIPKNWLSSVYRAFQKNPSIVGVWGPIEFSDTGFFERLLSRVSMGIFCLFSSLRGECVPASSNYAFKKSVFFGLDGFDAKYTTCEDLEFFSRAKNEGMVVFEPGMLIGASARRVKKMGYLNYLRFQLSNVKSFRETGKSSPDYPEVR